MPGQQSLDYDQVTETAGGAQPRGDAGARVRACRIIGGAQRIGRCRDGRRGAQELAAACQLLGAMARTEEAVVANPVKPRGQHVQQKAANEFRGGERHRLQGLRGIRPAILVGKAHLVVVDVSDPIVGDCDAMRVPPDIV